MTNAALNKAISLALGYKPTIVYAASQDEGKSVALWTDDIVRKAVVEQYCVAHPEYKVMRIERWTKWSSNAAYSYNLRSEMRKRGWSFRLEHLVAGKYSRAGMITDPKAVFEGDEEPFTAVGIDPEECRAIAIAAAKALGVWVEENKCLMIMSD